MKLEVDREINKVKKTFKKIYKKRNSCLNFTMKENRKKNKRTPNFYEKNRRECACVVCSIYLTAVSKLGVKKSLENVLKVQKLLP